MVDSLTAADTAELPLPGEGRLSVRTLPAPHGRARYLLHGRHVRGTLVVIPHTTYDGPVLAEQVRVQFGDGHDRAPHGQPRLDEPVVRGVRVPGHTTALDPRTVTANTPFLCGDAVAVREDGRTRRIPDGARTVLEAVVVAVVRHWHQRHDRDALILAAAQHRAGDRAAWEERHIRALVHELATVRAQRAHARHRINQITGLVRRRQPAILPPATTPARLTLVDGAGTALGVVTVLEREVIASLGRVVYEVHGARIHGLFTVGPDRYSSDPVPGGIYVFYGRPTGTGWHDRACRDEPTVNGVQLSGGWSHPRSGDITPTAPSRLPASVRIDDTRSHCAPDATSTRAGAVLRALALHYLDRPDVAGLRIAAGKLRAEENLKAARTQLARRRREETRVAGKLRHRTGRHRQFTALLSPAPSEQGAGEARSCGAARAT
ncbi:hypothetical protein [Streptomyces sp. NPDC004658]|uniref:Uncharacterized protein n=2 Tax=Streptomyces sp. F12 TaxID=1436084 RepID=V9Z3Z0_9ACTN|nr:Hypothetical protein pFRL6_118c [Streptomyces sp. F12]